MALNDKNLRKLLSFHTWEGYSRIFFAGDEDNLKFTVDCSDVFAWGSADCEEVTDENFHIMVECAKVVDYVLGKDHDDRSQYIDWLFAAKVRKMQPQGAVLDYTTNEILVQHFLDAGPMRTDVDAYKFKE